MNNIFIYSDDTYVKSALQALIREGEVTNCRHDEVAIFCFEGGTITARGLQLLLNCKTERILILAGESLLHFISSFYARANVFFGKYDDSLNGIKLSLYRFFSNRHNLLMQPILRLKKIKALTVSEQRIIGLFVQGLSLNSIATLLKISIKTVSAHRRSAMKKIGVESNLALVQRGRILQYMNIQLQSDMKLNESVLTDVPCVRPDILIDISGSRSVRCS